MNRKLVSTLIIAILLSVSFGYGLVMNAGASNFVEDIEGPDATFRDVIWNNNGTSSYVVGNDSANNGVVYTYTAEDETWNPISSVAGDSYNAISRTGSYTWTDDIESGSNGWTTDNWQSSTPAPAPTSSNSSLVGEWKFDEGVGQYTNDTSGRDNDGTLLDFDPGNADLNTPPVWTPNGVSGSALYFDGVDDYVDIDYIPNTFNNHDFSISVWVHPTASMSYGVIYAVGETGGGADKAIEFKLSSGVVDIWHWSDNWNTGCTVNLGEWTYLTYNYVSSTKTGSIYVDGQFENSHIFSGYLDINDDGYIPSQIGLGYPGRYYKGYIDEVQIYNKTLSSTEISDKYNITGNKVGEWKLDEGAGINAADTSQHSNLGTLTNMDDTNWVDGIFGKALHFDGSSEFVDCGNDTSLDLPHRFSIEAWVKPTSAGTGTYRTVVSKAIQNTATGISYAYLLSTDNRVIIYLGNGVTSENYISNTPLTPDVWNHIAIVATDTELISYLNGQPDGAKLTHTVTPQVIGSNVRIGVKAMAPTQYFNGAIDEVNIWNYSLSPDDILANYNNSLSNALVGDWKLDEGSGFLASDDTQYENDGALINMEEADWVDGISGKALLFDGVDEFVNCGNDSSLDMIDELTLEAWFKPQADGWKFKKALTISGSASPLTNHQVKIDLDAGNFDFSKADPNGDDIRFYDDLGTKLDYWIANWGAGLATVWVNVSSIPISGTTIYMHYGNSVASSESDHTAVFEPYTITYNIASSAGTFGNVGSSMYLGSPVNAPGGKALNIVTQTGMSFSTASFPIDLELQIWDGLSDPSTLEYTFSPQTVSTLGWFYSPVEFQEVDINNGLWVVIHKLAGGTASGVDCASTIPSGLGRYSADGASWNSWGGNPPSVFFNGYMRNTAIPEPSIIVGDENVVGISKLDAYGMGADTSSVYSSINGVVIDSAIVAGWNHAALTYDSALGSNHMKLYVNGALAGQANNAGGISSNGNDLIIGDKIAFNGTIDEVKVWSRALNDTEISERYSSFNVTASLGWQVNDPSTLPVPGSGIDHGIAASGNNIWWFGDNATGNYDTGERVTGSLVSPETHLPGSSLTGQLAFSHWFDVEPGNPGMDMMTVSIKNTTDGVWTELRYWDSDSTPISSWDNETIDITGWLGNDVQVSFTFDSVDENNNDYAGWHIDNITFQTDGGAYIVVGDIPTGAGYSAYVMDDLGNMKDIDGMNTIGFNDVAGDPDSASFVAVGGDVGIYYDGGSWNVLTGIIAGDSMNGVEFNGTHFFIVGHDSGGLGKSFYITQSELDSGQFALHSIANTPSKRLNSIDWHNDVGSGTGLVCAEGAVYLLSSSFTWQELSGNNATVDYTASTWNETGMRAIIVGNTPTRSVAYDLYDGNDYISKVPDYDNLFQNHKLYGAEYQPITEGDTEVMLVGASAFKIIPKFFDQTTQVSVETDRPSLFDIQFYKTSDGTKASRLNTQINVEDTYTFYTEVNYSSGGSDMLFDGINNTAMDIIAWYDDGGVNEFTIPAEDAEHRNRMFNVTWYEGDGGGSPQNAIMKYPIASPGTNEFQVMGFNSGPAGGDHWWIEIEVYIGSQANAADGIGFGNGVSGNESDAIQSFNDADSWNFMINMHDIGSPTASDIRYEEFGLFRFTNITVSGNPGGSAPPGTTDHALSGGSLITYSTNVDHFVNVSIPDMLRDGGGGSILATNVNVSTSSVLANNSNSQIDSSWGPAGRSFSGANMPLGVWGNASQVDKDIDAPKNGTTAHGPWGSDFNGHGATVVLWYVSVPAATIEGVYRAKVTFTIEYY